MADLTASVDLGKVALKNKGLYSATIKYDAMDFCTKDGNSWLCLIDGTVGVEPKEGANWQYLARGIDSYGTLSESYAKGGTKTREDEDTDNAKYYSEQAKAYADKAEASTNVSIATKDKAGLVKPDGTTITIDADGTIKGANDLGLTIIDGAINTTYEEA